MLRAMLIGELSRHLGVSADTLRFYERSGILPRPPRGENGYREYGPAELDRVRLLLDLRRLDLPLDEAARLAGWCQAGHCTETTNSGWTSSAADSRFPDSVASQNRIIVARFTASVVAGS
jgi:DNA-binding transcriptional MerR regulator